MRTLCLVITFLAVFKVLHAQPDTTQHITAGRKNSIEQQSKPYVILISADGFRHDYAEKYKAKNLLALSKNGVRSASMIPSFPSLTFPNHYSVVTGMYPSHHGIVNNSFYDERRSETYSMNNKKQVEDGSWYGGTPLWVLAEKQQMLTASFYWPGSEAPIQGVFPTYYYRYNESISFNKRVEVVRSWLSLPAEQRPHLITFYFPEVDHDGHVYGPETAGTEKAVQTLDSSIGLLVDAVASTRLPVNFVFLSDHGMTTVDVKNTLQLPPGVDTSKFNIPSDGNLLEMYAHDSKDILPAYKILKENQGLYKVYTKSNVPKTWHYGTKDDRYNRVGDLLVAPKWPKVFNIKNKKINVGWHGFDPGVVKDMHATFYAWGPDFKKGLEIPAFENVHVYPMLADLLKLKVTDKIDGKKKVLKNVLRKS